MRYKLARVGGELVLVKVYPYAHTSQDLVARWDFPSSRHRRSGQAGLGHDDMRLGVAPEWWEARHSYKEEEM